MPIFEYACKKCDHQFEALLKSRSDKVVCASCGSTSLRKLLSAFNASTSGASPADSCQVSGQCASTDTCSSGGGCPFSG